MSSRSQVDRVSLSVPMSRVLITGAAGTIGSTIRAALSGPYHLSGLDRVAVEGIPSVVADARDSEAMRAACADQDVVVDLANAPRGDIPWSVAYENNIASSYNCLESARAAGVKRVIIASSNRITEMYEQDEPYASICRGHYTGLHPSTIPLITTAMPIRPNGPYGIGKALSEAAGRYFSDAFGMSVICLRLGTFHGGDVPRATRQRATLLTPRDLAQLFQCAIDAPPELRFGIYYGVSNNRWRFWDISNAERELGYMPVDDAGADD